MSKKSDFKDLETLMYGTDMPDVDEQTLISRVEVTLDRYPTLREVYSGEFLTMLVGSGRDADNYLLLWLANPGNHIADQHWSEVAADLALLRAEGALAHYAAKLKVRDLPSVEVAKTELELAAGLKRRGHAIELEPGITGSSRRGEFVVHSDPPTWWEIKSVQDIEAVLRADRAQREIAKRLNRTREPYILNVQQRGIRPEQVPAALKDVVRRVRSIDAETARSLPVSFDAEGMTVEVGANSGKEYGHLGVSEQEFVFQDENILKVRKRINDSVAQIPRDGAGVVVIDTTTATWIDEDDVRQACFGEEVTRVLNGNPVDVLSGDAAFAPDVRTRISAVISYRRTGDGLKLRNAKRVYHNPYARTLLPFDLFREDGVEQWVIDRGQSRLWPRRVI